MGIFDFFSGKKKEKELQEQLRIQQEQKRHAEEKRKIAEQQKFQEQKRQEEKVLSNDLLKKNPILFRKDLTSILCQTWQKLDTNILEPFLDDNFKYNSVWVGRTLEGKDEYLHYLKGKFDTLRKTGSCPIVDVINEFGAKLPHLRQGNIEAVLDYEQNNGKLTHILMRPFVKIKVADNIEWGNYAHAYNEFLSKAVHIAGKAIQNYAKERNLTHPYFAWLQTNPNNPSFQHLCFRKGTRVYSIIVALHGFSSKDGEEDNSIVVNKKDLNLLLQESEKNNLIPCILPICCIPHIPMLGSNPLIDARTGERILLDEGADEDECLSEWELNNFGIFMVMDYLRAHGFSNMAYCDVVGINPQIFCEKEGKKSFVLVRTVPIGLKNSIFKINNNMLNNYKGFDAYFADVQVANAHNNGDFEDKVLYRCNGYFCKFNGLQNLEKAIAENPFIICDDKDSESFN